MVRLSAATWILAATSLVEVATAQNTNRDGGQHGLPQHGGGGDHEHGGQRGEHERGPPGDNGDRSGGEHGRHEDGDRQPPPACSADDSHEALEASSAYIECAGIDYTDFLALVQADLGLMEGAALCFAARADEIEHNKGSVKPGDADGVAIFDECVKQVENSDGTSQTKATADFLNTMLGPESKICSCLTDYVDDMPLCDQWKRFHHFGQRVEKLCEPIMANGGFLPLVVEEGEENKGEPAKAEGDVEVEAAKAAAVPEVMTETEETEGGAGGKAETERHINPRFPNAAPPCPPGQEQHPTDPTKCQGPPEESEFYEEHDERNDRGPPGSGGSLGLSALGVVVVGSVVGVGGVWLYGKFQSGTRQPGVRYMATGLENDMGTELGPFGREYP